MKRIVSFLLMCSLLLVMVGCRSTDRDITTTSSNTEQGEEQSVSTTESGIPTHKTNPTSTMVTTKTNATTINAVEQDASSTESTLANAAKLLQTDKKLTLGFIGGSITYGASALKGYSGDGTFSSFGGDLSLSWVNRIATWFQSQYPQATIETVNAGVSDTATNFGIFRLESTLMNTNGHDMPDVVFVEFNTNDWTYSTQTEQHLALQAESLFRNIYAINPYAEIVVVCTSREAETASRLAYQSVIKYYGIPMIDVGIPLTNAIQAKHGAIAESAGNYYYTVDNLHPSVMGYEVYFNQVKPFLEQQVRDVSLKSTNLYNYQAHLPKALNAALIDAPVILTADRLTVGGKVQLVLSPVTVGLYNIGSVRQELAITPSYLSIDGTASVSFTFTGTALGVLFQMNSSNIEMTYTIDGKSVVFKIDDDNLGFQRYNHAQAFMLAHGLEDKKHEVKFVFRGGNIVKLAGVLVG